MGWYYQFLRPDQTVKSFLTEELVSEKTKVLDIAIVRLKEAYIAAQRGDEIFAFVFSINILKDGEFGYKPMDETMNPIQRSCPKRILELLTPTIDARSNEWREACWETIRRRENQLKLEEGMIVHFDHALTWKNIGTFNLFKTRKYGKRSWAWRGYDGFWANQTLLKMHYQGMDHAQVPEHRVIPLQPSLYDEIENIHLWMETNSIRENMKYKAYDYERWEKQTYLRWLLDKLQVDYVLTDEEQEHQHFVVKSHLGFSYELIKGDREEFMKYLKEFMLQTPSLQVVCLGNKEDLLSPLTFEFV